MHAAHCYHRDIAPDNILLMAIRPAGAAGLRRRAARDQRQDAGHHGDPEARLRADRAVRRDARHGAGPVDRRLCAGRGDARRGLRARAAALGGAAPGRQLRAAGATRRGRRYSAALPAAIDNALAVKPEKRTTSIEAMRVELFGDALPAAAPIAGAAAAGTAAQDVPRSQPHPRTETLRHEPTRQMVPPTEQRVRTEAAPAAPTQGSSSKMPLVAGGIGLIVVAALGRVRALAEVDAARPTTTAPAIATPAVTVAPAASVATASAPAPTPVVATPRVDAPVVVAPAASAAPATVTTAPTTSPPRDAPPARPNRPPRPIRNRSFANLRRRAKRLRSPASGPPPRYKRDRPSRSRPTTAPNAPGSSSRSRSARPTRRRWIGSAYFVAAKPSLATLPASEPNPAGFHQRLRQAHR